MLLRGILENILKSHSNLNQKVIFIFLCLHLLLHFQASSPSKTNITLRNGGKVWMVSCFYFQSKVGCNTVQSILMRSTLANRNIINSTQDPRKSKPNLVNQNPLFLSTKTIWGPILKVRICLEFVWESSVGTIWTTANRNEAWARRQFWECQWQRQI